DNRHRGEGNRTEGGAGGGGTGRGGRPPRATPDPSVRPDPTVKPDPVVDPVAPPKIEVVTIWVATENIPANTEITKDLIAEKFKAKEFRVGDVEEALEPKQVEGKTLVHGLAKGQWVTGAAVGDPTLKPS